MFRLGESKLETWVQVCQASGVQVLTWGRLYLILGSKMFLGVGWGWGGLISASPDPKIPDPELPAKQFVNSTSFRTPHH